MAGRPRKKIPADPGASAVLEAIEHTLMEGTAPPAREYPFDEETRKRLDMVISEILATQQFALAMAQGDLSRDLAMKGYLAGSLKSLQASLRHITWQAGQIAGGDLSQRVHFMGEFSDSFNAMTENLDAHAVERMRKEQELLAANTALASEIVEHRRLEDALALTNRKLSLLASITRHDIRNQLVALDGYISLGRENTGDPAAVRSYLDRGERVVATIISQINFTKDYEELGVKEPVWNKLDTLVAGASAALPFGNIRLVAKTGGAEVFADLLISRVFYNLMDNALRYGGASMTEIRITAAEGPDGLVITVQDNGAGISPQDKEKLFIKGFGKNTGFGLHLSREILSLTGITIVEDSEPGAGARFRITVPKGAYRFG
jgi:signal transduction histidine kinase